MVSITYGLGYTVSSGTIRVITVEKITIKSSETFQI